MNTSKKLLHLFMKLPPDFDAIDQLLKTEDFSSECISESFCKFAEACFCEYSDFLSQHGRKPLDEELHSTYIFSLCEVLLNHGLNPNYVFGEMYSESNVMYEVYWIDKPYVAADTLKLLLENSGNPLTRIDNESIWDMSDFDIWFDVSHGYAQHEDYLLKFDSRVHFWLVLRGFMSTAEECFKEHSLYTYRLIQTDENHWDIQIIRK